MLEQPALGLAQCALSQRLPGHAFVKLQSSIKREKEIPPGKKPIAPGKRGGAGTGIAEELVDAHRFAQFPIRLMGVKDREGNDDSASPGGHFVDVDRKPGWEQHQLRGNGGRHLPNHGTHQSEIKSGVGVRGFEAAELQHTGTSTLHVRLIGAVAGKLEGKISFDRGIEFGGTAEINIPAAVRQLALANIIGELAYTLGIGFIQDMQIENIVGFQSGVGLELANPIPLGGLQRQQMLNTLMGGGLLLPLIHEGAVQAAGCDAVGLVPVLRDVTANQGLGGYLRLARGSLNAESGAGRHFPPQMYATANWL